MARRAHAEPSRFEPGLARESDVRPTPQLAVVPTSPQPEKLPPFVVLEDSFGWMQNGSLLSFKAEQVIYDRSLVRELIARKAPLLSYA